MGKKRFSSLERPLCRLVLLAGLSALLLAYTAAAAAPDFKVVHQVTGAIKTNCYLISEIQSGESALVDPGGPVADLLGSIQENQLQLKYILVTHGHIDHVFGIPVIKKLFPKAKLCMHEFEYRDLFTQLEWAVKNYGPSWLEQVQANPETRPFLGFDMKAIGRPDIFIAESTTLPLGALEIRVIHCPGHSAGGVCFQVGNVLFSGDTLFYRTVGRTDSQNGSREDLVKSVRKLYRLLPDETTLYPGHEQFTDIGSEKKLNKRITLDGGEWGIK